MHVIIRPLRALFPLLQSGYMPVDFSGELCSSRTDVRLLRQLRADDVSVWTSDRHAIVKVLLADGDYLVVYGCDAFSAAPDDRCEPGRQYIYMLTRTKVRARAILMTLV